MLTGMNWVRDIFCGVCDKHLGWAYDFTADEREMYKVQRFVLERKLIRVIMHGAFCGALGEELLEEIPSTPAYMHC